MTDKIKSQKITLPSLNTGLGAEVRLLMTECITPGYGVYNPIDPASPLILAAWVKQNTLPPIGHFTFFTSIFGTDFYTLSV